MMNKLTSGYILFFLFFQKVSFSQTTYIIDSTYFEKISDNYFLKNNDKQFEYTDTSIISFQYSLPFYFNGQMGTAQPDYLLQNTENTIGSRVFSFFYPDILQKEQISLYRTKGFYSKMEGIAGSKDEQHFRAVFISPVKENHQINFYFRRSTNTGFYLNQKASVTNLFADYHWFGKKRWSVDASVLLNYFKHQENGGIIKDSLSYTDLFLDKTLIPVSLPDARKNIRQNEFQYRVNYLIKNDSIWTHALSFSPLLKQVLFQYMDNYPLSGYYSFVFLDTLKTNDSLHSLKAELPLSYSLKHRNTFAQITYDYQINTIHLYQDTVISNHFLRFKFNSRFNLFNKAPTEVGREIQYVLYGTQKGNYLINLFVESRFNKIIFSFTTDILKQSPAYQQNYWYSNHFTWYNRFKDVLRQEISFNIRYLSAFKLSYRLLFLENYIYFFNDYPLQYQNTLNIHQFKSELDKVFFRHLGINAVYYYQWKSADVLALPEHFLNANLYYQGRWFHKNLLVNTGFQFISAFNYFDTYSYNPATGVYSLRFNNIQAGNYPQIAFYFSGRIKPVNFFIRIDNILSGFYPYPYYFVSHYMMPDRAFRMGISWMFFD